MIRFLLPLAIFSATTLGQTITITVPPCATTCFDPAQNGIDPGICDTTDRSCLCLSHNGQYGGAMNMCINSKCVGNDNEYFTAMSALVRYCKVTDLSKPVVFTTGVITIPSTTSTRPVSTVPTFSPILTSISSPGSQSSTTPSSSNQGPTTSGSATSSTSLISTIFQVTLPSETPTNDSAVIGPPIDAPNTPSQNSADKANAQRQRIIGIVLGSIALVGSVIFVLVLLKRRKRMATRKRARLSTYAREGVVSDPTTVQPWKRPTVHQLVPFNPPEPEKNALFPAQDAGLQTEAPIASLPTPDTRDQPQTLIPAHDTGIQAGTLLPSEVGDNEAPPPRYSALPDPITPEISHQ